MTHQNLSFIEYTKKVDQAFHILKQLVVRSLQENMELAKLEPKLKLGDLILMVYSFIGSFHLYNCKFKKKTKK